MDSGDMPEKKINVVMPLHQLAVFAAGNHVADDIPLVIVDAINTVILDTGFPVGLNKLCPRRVAAIVTQRPEQLKSVLVGELPLETSNTCIVLVGTKQSIPRSGLVLSEVVLWNTAAIFGSDPGQTATALRIARQKGTIANLGEISAVA